MNWQLAHSSTVSYKSGINSRHPILLCALSGALDTASRFLWRTDPRIRS